MNATSTASSPAALAVSTKELDLRFRALMASFDQRQSQSSGGDEALPKGGSLDGLLSSTDTTQQRTDKPVPKARSTSSVPVVAPAAAPEAAAVKPARPRQAAEADAEDDAVAVPVVDLPPPSSARRQGSLARVTAHRSATPTDYRSPADRVAMLPRASANTNMRGLLARSGLLDSPLAMTPSPYAPRFLPGKAKVSLADLARTPEAGSPELAAIKSRTQSASSTPLSVLAEDNARREEEVRVECKPWNQRSRQGSSQGREARATEAHGSGEKGPQQAQV